MATLVIKCFPEERHGKLKAMAAARRRSVTQEKIHLIEAALASEESARVAEAPTSYWATRELLPEFEEALKAGAFSGGRDSTEIISIDRHLLAAASAFRLTGVNVIS